MGIVKHISRNAIHKYVWAWKAVFCFDIWGPWTQHFVVWYKKKEMTITMEVYYFIIVKCFGWLGCFYYFTIAILKILFNGLLVFIIQKEKQAWKKMDVTHARFKPASLQAQQLLSIVSMCTAHCATVHTRLVFWPFDI